MNARTTLPNGITQTQSFSWVLREIFLSTLQAIPFFGVFNVRRTPALPVQVAELPTLALYIMDETMVPDGDGNAGPITFIHDLKLGFSSVIQNNDPDAIEQKLDMIFWAIMNGLWRDQNITNKIHARTPDNVRFEGVTLGRRRHKFGAAGLNQETPVAELQYEATVRYRADYGPIIQDDLLLIHLQTAFPLGGDPASVEQVVVEYDLTSQRSKSDVEAKE